MLQQDKEGVSKTSSNLKRQTSSQHSNQTSSITIPNVDYHQKDATGNKKKVTLIEQSTILLAKTKDVEIGENCTIK